MIDIVKQTPLEYSKQSRDYQVIARLYTALFNYSKMYVDSMNVWNDDIDNKLTTLRARSLNFIPDHSWDLDDLEAITSCFKYLVRNKGTVTALEYCINILMKIEKIDSEIRANLVTIDDQYNVIIRVPDNLITLGIVEDLVKYLLPAGLTYRIILYKSYNLNDAIWTDVKAGVETPVHRDVAYTKKMWVGNNLDSEGRHITNTFIYTDSEGIRAGE